MKLWEHQAQCGLTKRRGNKQVLTNANMSARRLTPSERMNLNNRIYGLLNKTYSFMEMTNFKLQDVDNVAVPIYPAYLVLQALVVWV